METYRLEVREGETSTGIDATVYDEDGLIETSTRVAYEEYGLEPADERSTPSPITSNVTADLTTIDLQFERDDAGFVFRLLGDRDELVSERVDEEVWGLE